MPVHYNAWIPWRSSRANQWRQGDLVDADHHSLAHQWSLQTIVATLQAMIFAVSIGEHMRDWKGSSCVSLKPRKT
jgi:hypothetical protein